jgi:hypothetical protein
MRLWAGPRFVTVYLWLALRETKGCGSVRPKVKCAEGERPEAWRR